MKLIMLRGLPASGKTTLAKEYVAQGNWVRVNRDLIREMLHFSKWSPQNEKLTVGTEKMVVRAMLDEGQNVVVDDTNLFDKHRDMWRTIAGEMEAKFEVVSVDTSMDECCARNSARQHDKSQLVVVPNAVIVEMALASGRFPDRGKPFVICDIDGTVADLTHRRYHLDGEAPNWRSFFDAMSKDEPRRDVITEVHNLKNEGHPIFFVSGRPDDYRAQTEAWLSAHVHFEREALIMRKAGDTRPDTDVKLDIYNKLFAHHDILCVFDDRPSVIRMWRDQGVKVKDVGDGVEF